MKVLWVHNFNPNNPTSGIFMYQIYSYLKDAHSDELELDILYLGSLRNPINVLKRIIYLRRVGKNYDVVHAQYGSMCGLVTSFSSSSRNILTLRGSDWSSLGKLKLKNLHNSFQNILTKFSINKYAEVTAPSNRIASEVLTATGKNCLFLPSPVDLEKFYPMDKDSAKRHLGLSQHIRYFLFPTAREDNPIKRSWLIKVLKECLPDNIKIISATNVAHSDMVFYYNAVEAVILPSVYEGWPNVIKEALLCNIPFIATDVSDLRQISEVYSSCRIVHPDEGSLRAAIEDHKSTNENLRSCIEWMSLQNLSRIYLEKLYMCTEH